MSEKELFDDLDLDTDLEEIKVEKIENKEVAASTEEPKKEEKSEDLIKEEKKPTKKKKTTSKSTTTESKVAPKTEPKKGYEGVRKVVVYGQELFEEIDHTIDMDVLRQRVVDEFNFEEFSKDRTTMSLDEKTGIVVPIISFNKKG